LLRSGRSKGTKTIPDERVSFRLYYSRKAGEMKAEKRGNKWRVRVFDYTDENGKKHNRSFTADTKAEAEYLAAQFKANKSKGRKSPSEMTVGDAVDKYIKLKALLSPTTLDAYKAYRQYAFPDLMKMRVSRLSDIVIQEEINKEAIRISENTGKPLSAKTVKNEWALVSGSLSLICNRTFRVTLPKAQTHLKSYPEIERVIVAIVGSEIELPCMLAVWLSFSMSEIRGLRCSDIKDGYITINRTMVDTRAGTVVKDDAKVESRLRRHRIPPYINALIEDTDSYKHFIETGEDDFLIKMNRRKIYDVWERISKENGIDLSVHGLRHMNATVMHMVGVPLRVARERGGWSTDRVMLDTYTHVLDTERIHYDDVMDEFFESRLPKKSAQDL